MKIGILTHHYIANFGAFLQAYALQETLKKEFPEDEIIIINFIHLKHFLINNCGWFRYYKKKETLSAWKQKIRLPKTFSSARSKHLSLSQYCFSASDINKLNLDVIVVGSDEVWNFNDKKSNSQLKFGKNLQCKKLISYAPSVGNSGYNDSIPEYVREGLKSFHAISVRDTMGQELVNKITGKRPIKVLDPTFLIKFPTEKVTLPNKNYILFYYAEHLPENITKQIIDYAIKNNLAIYGAGECDKAYTDVTVNLSPFQWVEMFKNAQFVVTGTFHGVALSIENHRQFKVYLTQKNRIKKVNDLLSTLDIHNREIDTDSDFKDTLQKNEIDYEKVDRIIESMKACSLNYLKTSIKK